jgi:hypothetical protein
VIVHTPEQAHAILAGTKTQHREKARHDTSGYRTGRVNLVRVRRGDPPKCRITIQAVTDARHGDITDQQARAEGFKNTQDALDHYDTVGLKPDDPVWIISFELDRMAEVRLLHRHSEKGYTTQPHEAVHGEGEAVDEATLDEFARKARENHKPHVHDRDTKREARTLQRRLREATIRAERAGIDVSPELAEIRRQLDEIERKRAA